jgi:excisionase family DNA binding protein
MVPRIYSEIAMKPRSDATPRRRMMTVADVARYLNMQPGTVYKLIHKGSLPAFMVAAEYRFDKEELETWISDHKFVPSAEPRAEDHLVYVDLKTFEQSIDRIFNSAEGFIPLRSAWSRFIPPN